MYVFNSSTQYIGPADGFLSPVNIKDCTLQYFTDSSPVTRMTITHNPTGVSVQGEGLMSSRLKISLMTELHKKIKEH